MARKLKVYLEKCQAMLDELDIPYCKDIEELSVSHAERRWGRTVWKNVNGERQHFKIEISYKLVNPKYTETDDGLINTMIHELLHTCPDGRGHGVSWKKYAQMVYDRYGIDIKRCGSDDEKGANKDVIKNTYKYMLKCKCCGKEIGRYKMSPVISNYTAYHCGTCNGELIRIR